MSASVVTIPVAVIVPFTVAIESHPLIFLLSEYPCFLKPERSVAPETNDTMTLMYFFFSRNSNKRGINDAAGVKNEASQDR